MSLADMGMAAIVVCNVLFLLLCTYMAWRMVNHMQDSQADLSAYADSLKAHAGRLSRTADETRDSFGDLRRELGKLAEAARTSAAAAGRAAPPARPGDPYQQWSQRDPKALNRLIDQQGDLLSEMNQLDARQFDGWRRSKQAELDQLLQQKQRVLQDFARLKQSHDEAVQRLRDQEVKSRQHQRTATEAQALRQQLQALQQELQQAEARAVSAEQNARSAQDGTAAPAAPQPRVKELAEQLAEAEADRQRLRRQLEQSQDKLKRTLTEKEFIEDRFLALDADRAAADPAASEPA